MHCRYYCFHVSASYPGLVACLCTLYPWLCFYWSRPTPLSVLPLWCVYREEELIMQRSVLHTDAIMDSSMLEMVSIYNAVVPCDDAFELLTLMIRLRPLLPKGANSSILAKRGQTILHNQPIGCLRCQLLAPTAPLLSTVFALASAQHSTCGNWHHHNRIAPPVQCTHPHRLACMCSALDPNATTRWHTCPPARPGSTPPHLIPCLRLRLTAHLHVGRRHETPLSSNSSSSAVRRRRRATRHAGAGARRGS